MNSNSAIVNDKSTRLKTKVLILGAGIAGLSAAKTLHKNGVEDFIVLEAQDYIGGRVKQIDFAGLKLEEGANWIQYVGDNNPIWQQKVLHNFAGVQSNYSDIVIRDENGANVTDNAVLEDWDNVKAKAFELIEERNEKGIGDIPASVGFAMVGWHADTPAKKAIEYLRFDFEHGDPPDKISFNNMDMLGEEFFISDSRGFLFLFKHLYSDITDKIKLNTIVRRISHSESGTEITTANGLVYSADYVVCTFSTGVLASQIVSFEPPLPCWKMAAVHKLRLACYTKMFVKFERKFWDENQYILLASRKRGRFTVMQNLDQAGLFRGSNILHVTATGEEGLRLESQSDDETLTELMEALRQMYGKDIPFPSEFFISKFSQNPCFGGSYTDPVVGTTSDDFANLGRRIDRLFFAGESTHPEYYGFVQGALFSGEEKAREIVAIIEDEDKDKFDR